MILEHDGIPVALGGIDDSALGYAVATSADGALQDALAFVGSQQLLAAPAGLGAGCAARPVDFKHVVVVADVVEVGSFCPQPHSFTRGVDERLVDAPFLNGAKVGFQFGDA